MKNSKLSAAKLAAKVAMKAAEKVLGGKRISALENRCMNQNSYLLDNMGTRCGNLTEWNYGFELVEGIVITSTEYLDNETGESWIN